MPVDFLRVKSPARQQCKIYFILIFHTNSNTNDTFGFGGGSNQLIKKNFSRM